MFWGRRQLPSTSFRVSDSLFDLGNWGEPQAQTWCGTMPKLGGQVAGREFDTEAMCMWSSEFRRSNDLISGLLILTFALNVPRPQLHLAVVVKTVHVEVGEFTTHFRLPMWLDWDVTTAK